jgi:FkbM family methyltransferase
VQAFKRKRRGFYEARGSDRYSRPSLGGLESALAQHLPERAGVFVEAGAYDGYWQSNTYWLERFRSWTGVLIEPIPDLAAKARKDRPRSKVYQCALVADDAEGSVIRMRRAGTMSMVSGGWGSEDHERAWAEAGATAAREKLRDVVVPARTLTEVLDDAGVDRIDLLSLDVEGYEASVLRGLDLSRYAPSCVLVEIHDAERRRAEIEAVLGERYEHIAQVSFVDHLYRLIDHTSGRRE